MIAFLSFEFVESPFRGDSRVSRRQIFAFGLATSVLSAVLGFSLYLTRGFPGRFDKGTLQLIAMNTDRKKDYENVPANWRTEIHTMADIKFSYIGDPSAKKIMFLGDSHVQQLFPLIRGIYDRGALGGHGAVFALAAGCPPAEHLNRIEPGFHCDIFTHFALQRALEDDIDTVFIGFNTPLGFWDLCPSVDGNCVGKISVEEGRRRFFEELGDHIQTLKSRGKRIIVSLPFPRYDESVPDLEARNAQLQKLGWALAVTETDSPDVRAQVASVAQSLGSEIFDPRKSLCPRERCITQQGEVSIYVDDLHIAASQIGILNDDMVRTLQGVLCPLSKAYARNVCARSRSTCGTSQ